MKPAAQARQIPTNHALDNISKDMHSFSLVLCPTSVQRKASTYLQPCVDKCYCFAKSSNRNPLYLILVLARAYNHCTCTLLQFLLHRTLNSEMNRNQLLPLIELNNFGTFVRALRLQRLYLLDRLLLPKRSPAILTGSESLS